MAKTKMPSADQLLAEVIDEKCGSLAHKIANGEGMDVGILLKNNIPFVWELKWSKQNGKVLDFHLKVFHVRPRTFKLVADRHFNNPEGE